MPNDLRTQSLSHILIVDSDNTLNLDFRRLDNELFEAGYGFYTVLDEKHG